MNLDINDLDKLTQCEFRNRDLLMGKPFTAVSTDSRKVTGGELFIALKGATFDGHVFVGDVFSRGAAAAIVDSSFDSGTIPDRPLLVVKDTTRALGELAHLYRAKFGIPVIAIGGSNGKTTTKDMVSAVLGTAYKVLSTEGNLNNHLGVPQTLLRLRKEHRIAVVEIGTNHPGEIDGLCRILDPTHGLVTNVGREHLEFFKSVEGVAREEGVLIDYLKKKKSVVFVNADDEFLRGKARGMRRQVAYGLNARGVDIGGKIVGVDGTGCVSFEYRGKMAAQRGTVRLAIPGEPNVMNALAAIAVGRTFRVTKKKIQKALESFRPTTRRMEVLNCGGVLVYNDTYNANPDSMIAALKTLASAKVSGKKIAVLADMRELGDHAAEEHRQVGRTTARLGIDYLLTYGEHARSIHDAAEMTNAFHYDQKNMLAEYLVELVTPGDAVLVKGSRGMKMEDIVTFLEERSRSAGIPHV